MSTALPRILSLTQFFKRRTQRASGFALVLLLLVSPALAAGEPVAATVETSLVTASGQIRQFAFDGKPDTYFLSDKNPGPTDYFSLVLEKPVAVKSVLVTTGRDRKSVV